MIAGSGTGTGACPYITASTSSPYFNEGTCSPYFNARAGADAGTSLRREQREGSQRRDHYPGQ